MIMNAPSFFNWDYSVQIESYDDLLYRRYKRKMIPVKSNSERHYKTLERYEKQQEKLKAWKEMLPQ